MKDLPKMEPTSRTNPSQNWKLETGSQKMETGSWKMETGISKMDVRSQKREPGSQKMVSWSQYLVSIWSVSGQYPEPDPPAEAALNTSAGRPLGPIY